MSRAQQNFWNTLQLAVQQSSATGEAVPMPRMVHLDRPCGCDEWPIAAYVYWPSGIWIFECHACFATFTDTATAPRAAATTVAEEPSR